MVPRKVLLSLITALVLLSTPLLITLLPAAQVPKIPLVDAQSTVLGANWERVNYEGNGGSYNPQTQITKDNVQYLDLKWVYPYNRPTTPQGLALGYGAMAPVNVIDGVAIVTMNDRRVLALDATTGKLIWNNTYGNTYNASKLTGNYPWLSAPGSHTHAISFYREKGWLIPSAIACNSYAIDFKTGKTAWTMTPEQMCGTTAEFGQTAKLIPGTFGRGFINGQAHPPVFLGDTMWYPIGGGSGSGGTAFITAFDMSDPQHPKRLYRNLVVPNPYSPDPNFDLNLCKEVNGNGWYFEYPKYLEAVGYPNRDKPATYLATKCTDVDPEVLKNDWIDMVPGDRDFGKVHSASAVVGVWGNYPLDPETGIVYVGWGDQGPYGNLTMRYGPGTPGSAIEAFNVKTGKLVWFFNAHPHDMWDYDCSWNGMLTKVQGKTALIKGCKDGAVYALDGATGKPIWIWDAPSLKRTVNYGVAKAFVADKSNPKGWKETGDNTPNGADACCRMTKKDMSKGWMIAPEPGPMTRICGEVCLESDIATDGKKLYVGHFNWVDTKGFGNVRDFGNNDVGGGIAQTARSIFPDSLFETNTNIDAVDINTGKLIWTYRIEGTTNRGGIMVTGGMVVAYTNDAILRFIDADTGKLISQKSFGIPINVMPTIGATKEGKMQIFVHVGGATQGNRNPYGQAWSTTNPVDGVLAAYGLPDKIPEPQVVTKEVIKEVPKEVIKEVQKEVVKTVTVETVSPISYAVIGIGVVLVVIAGVLFTRRKKA